MSASSPERCGACNAPALELDRRLRRGGRLVRCAGCGHRELRGFPFRPDVDEFSGVDAQAYDRAMSPERRASAVAVVQELVEAGAHGPLLDVGCSFGWLLEAAVSAGLDAYGVDPSASAVEDARTRGLQVRHGHFPAEDWGRRDWGVVAYMDVLEHIPALDLALRETVAHLRPGGFLATQLPVSTGIVYQTAAALERWSGGLIDGPMRRMLQTEFPYPHVHYFRQSSLEALLARFGLRPIRFAFGPIATGNFVERVSFRDQVTLAQRAEAVALRTLVAFGRATGQNDLLRLIAQRAP